MSLYVVIGELTINESLAIVLYICYKPSIRTTFGLPSCEKSLWMIIMSAGTNVSKIVHNLATLVNGLQLLYKAS